MKKVDIKKIKFTSRPNGKENNSKQKDKKQKVEDKKKKTGDADKEKISKIDSLIKSKEKEESPKTSKSFLVKEVKKEEKPIEKTELEPKKIESKKETLPESKTIPKKPIETTEFIGTIVERKTGFGWKGQGSRRIIFDNRTKQYRYFVLEPQLTEEEEELKDKLIHLFRVRADTDVFEIDDYEKTKQLEESLEKLIKDQKIEVTDESKDKIFYYIVREFIGYDKIDVMMHDEGIEDISCDGHKIPIFVYHKTYENIKSNVIFNNVDELNNFVVKLSQMCGKQISVYEPVVDGKLADGSRLQVTLGKTITKYSTFTIRRFREDPLTPIDLIDNHTMSIEMAAYFWMAIENGASVLFCGGTASGKTTMLNALSLFLPTAYKIVSVEDTREINLPHENWIAGTTRTGFSSTESSKTGKDIDMFDLIRVALRQRPRAIIVGEVRGVEAYSLFQAMTTGHLSYSTVHASDMHSLIQRLESPPINLPRALLTSLEMVVFLNNLTVKGKPVRRITNVTEIIKLDPETNRLVTISPFYWVSEIQDRFEDTGGSKIINKIKLENMWSDARLEKEIKNRIKVLKWMLKNKKRSYTDVGKIVSDYYNDSDEVLKKIED